LAFFASFFFWFLLSPSVEVIETSPASSAFRFFSGTAATFSSTLAALALRAFLGSETSLISVMLLTVSSVR
jgi:hypothetical protein